MILSLPLNSHELRLVPLITLLFRRRTISILTRNVLRGLQILGRIRHLFRQTQRQHMANLRRLAINRLRHLNHYLKQGLRLTLSTIRADHRHSNISRMQINRKIKATRLSTHERLLTKLMSQSTSRAHTITRTPHNMLQRKITTHNSTLMQISHKINSNTGLTHIHRSTNRMILNSIKRVMLLITLTPGSIITIIVRRQLTRRRDTTILTHRQLKRGKNITATLMNLLLGSRFNHNSDIKRTRNLNIARTRTVLQTANNIRNMLRKRKRLLRHRSHITARITNDVARQGVRMTRIIRQLKNILIKRMMVLRLNTRIRRVTNLLNLTRRTTRNVTQITNRQFTVKDTRVTRGTYGTIVTQTPQRGLRNQDVKRHRRINFLKHNGTLSNKTIGTGALLGDSLRILKTGNGILRTTRGISGPRARGTSVALLCKTRCMVSILLIRITPLSFKQISANLCHECCHEGVFPRNWDMSDTRGAYTGGPSQAGN